MRRLVFPLIAAILLSACGDRNPGETRVAVIGNTPEIVDPSRAIPDAGDAVLMGALARGLVQLNGRGLVEPGLAERWHVSEDGRSYIFRLGSGEWADGEPIEAREVAAALDRLVKARDNPIRDALLGIDEIVAMTDRVIEIRLSRPRPNLLLLLARPELAILSRDEGSGPFRLGELEDGEDGGGFHLSRMVPDRQTEELTEEVVHLSPTDAETAIDLFRNAKVELVLGGTFADLPYVQIADLPGDSLRFDPAIGLFGLQPVAREGMLADDRVLNILNRAIDRDALVADLGVPGLASRATIFQPGLNGFADPVEPGWLATPIGDRQGSLALELQGILEAPEIPGLPILSATIALPDGPGADILFNRVAEDWRRLGVELKRAAENERTDFVLIDEVAPAPVIDWFVNRFRCARTHICSEEVEPLFEQASQALTISQRRAILSQAASQMDSAALFFSLAAPVRWSLVSPNVIGFATNPLAHHPLTALKSSLPPETAQ